MAEDKGQQRDGADEGHGDTPGDYLAADEVDAADEESDLARFAEAAGHDAEEHVQVAVIFRHGLAGIEVSHRGSHRDAVNGLDVHARHSGGYRPLGHDDGVGRDEERTACESRVQEVLAEAAVELLDDDNREEVADERQPPGGACWQGHRKEHTGQQCGTVADGFGLLEELAVCPLIENRGEHRHGDHENGLHAEFPCCHCQRRQQSQHHVYHDAAGVHSRPYLRLIRNVKDDFFFFLAHYFWASFAAFASAAAFSLAAFAWNMSFAVLKAWVRGILAGQLNAQLPHSKQSVM